MEPFQNVSYSSLEEFSPMFVENKLKTVLSNILFQSKLS